MEYKWFIGTDISKITLDFIVRNKEAVVFHLEVENNKQGVRSFFRAARQQKVDLSQSVFCMEHTGIYNAVVLEELYSSGCSVWLENAVQIKRSMGLTRGKSDKIDAERIAEYAMRFIDKVRIWTPSREQLQALKQLTSLRRRLMEARNQLRVPLKETKSFISKSLYHQLVELNARPLAALNDQIKSVESEIRKLIRSDEHLSKLFSLVTSVDGVGEVLFWELITTTNEFKSITDPRKYACYAGVAPFEHASGTSVRGKTRVSKMGNKSVKKLLHLAAMSAVAMNGELSDYYQRKVAEGKNKMATLNAIRNKIILRVFACVRDQRPFEKNYQPRLA